MDQANALASERTQTHVKRIEICASEQWCFVCVCVFVAHPFVGLLALIHHPLARNHLISSLAQASR